MSGFWVRFVDPHDGQPQQWREVDKQTYVNHERNAGFHNTMGQPNEPATGSFSSTEWPWEGRTYPPGSDL